MIDVGVSTAVVFVVIEEAICWIVNGLVAAFGRFEERQKLFY